VLPELGNDELTPSIETEAFGSDDCQERVTGTPEHTLLFESESVTLGSVHALLPDPGATDLRRPAIGGGFGRVTGAKLIAVTGWISMPFGATPCCP
jgi:hypothetical protein